MSTRVRWIPLVSLAVGVSLSSGAGCQNPTANDPVDTATIPDRYEAELFSTTRELSGATVAAIEVIEPDGTIRFTGTPDELRDLAYKNVLLAGPSAQTGAGFIRMVTSVEPTSEGLVAQTVPVPIQFAFRRLDLKITRTIPDLAKPEASVRRAVWYAKALQRSDVLWTKKPLDFFVFNGDDDPSTEDDQVHVTGYLSGGVDYTFGINVDWGDVFDIPEELAECAKSLFTSCSVEDLMPEAKVGFSLIGGVNAELNMEGVSLLPFSRPIPIYQHTYEPIKIGPLWFFPNLDVTAEIEGAASSEFALGSTIDLSAGAEVAYSNKTGPSIIPPHVDSLDIQSPTVEVSLRARSKVRLGPNLALKLYQTAGPYAGIYGFVKLEADATHEPCWTLDGGVEGELGFVIQADIPMFGKVTVADWREPIDIWSTNVSSGSCTGDVTDALTQFQQPTFDPWSSAYGNTVTPTGLPFSGPGGGVVWTELQQTIDGYHVLAGSGSRSLTKIDGDGRVIWSKGFEGPTLGDPFIDYLLPDRVAYSLDAGMFVSAYPWTLLKVDAAGTLVWARQAALSPDSDWWRVSDLEADGSGGLYLTAGYGVARNEPLELDAVIGRIDSEGNSVWLLRVGDVRRGEVPRLIVPFAGGIIVAGSRWDLDQPGRWRIWAMRLGEDGTVIWKKSFPVIDCATSFELSAHPLAGHEAEDGDLILGGTIDGAPERAFFAKIKPDGTLSFMTGYKVVHSLNLEDLSLSALTPLPTSGYLATGTYLPYPYDREHDFWIGALDGVGQFQWVARLKGADFSSELLPAVRYTPDGGLLAAGYSETLAGGALGLWALKAFAKDGTISFSPASGITAEALNLAKEVYCPTTVDWSVPVAPMVLEFSGIDVVAKELSVMSNSLSP